MSQITIYHDADVTVNVVPGTPPVDQSALVAQLQADLTDMTAQRDALQVQVAQFKTFRDAVVADAEARKVADAAKVEGQDLIDAAAGLPA